jgi:hypothetical protein
MAVPRLQNALPLGGQPPPVANLAKQQSSVRGHCQAVISFENQKINNTSVYFLHRIYPQALQPNEGTAIQKNNYYIKAEID